jgi:hypothetical protein
MIDINHFKFFAFFSGDVAMTEQLRWNWLRLIHLYSYR